MRIRRLLSEIKSPLHQAITLLSPHFADIRAEWEKRLASTGIGEEELKALFPLTVEAQHQNLGTGNFDAYRQDLDRQGQVLERIGIPQAQIAASLGFYFECCLPYLVGTTQRKRDPAWALARLVATTQLLTLSSCAMEGVANWRKLQEQERLNFSRDLHDDIGHNLLVLKLYLEMMATDLKRGDVSQLQSKLEEALALVSYSVDSVRRLILDLGPAMLAQFGFLPALRIYARQFTLRTGIQVHMDEANLPQDLPSSYETALYRVLQGALSNVVRHSRAKHVAIKLGSIKKAVLVMGIEDDGVGFDHTGTLSQRAFGLAAMRERIERLGGKFHIESWPIRPGSRRHGTRIEVDLSLRGMELTETNGNAQDRRKAS